MEVARGTEPYALYVLAITTGMRQRNLLGLNREDVDLRTETLQVKALSCIISGRNTESSRISESIL